MKTIIFSIVSLFGISCGAAEWIPYVPQARIVQETIVQQPIVNVPQVYYQWVPYTVSQPVVLERRCLFFKRTVVEYIPVTQWVYQPLIIQN